MSRAWGALLVIVIFAGLGFGPLGVRVARANKLRVLVLDVEGPSLTPASRSTLAQGLMSGLSASGVDAMRAADLKAPIANGRGCGDSICWGRLLADPMLAPAYVVRSAVSMAGSTYQLRVEMLDPRTSQVVETREDVCEICTDAEAGEALGMAASALKVAVSKRNPGGAGTTGPGVEKNSPIAAPVSKVAALPPPVSSAGSATSLPGSLGGQQAPDTKGSSARMVVSWALVGAGAAAIAAGIFQIMLDGKDPSSCQPSIRDANTPCRDVHSGTVQGSITMGLGLAAGVAGGWMLATSPNAQDSRVALGSGWKIILKRSF